MTATAMPPAANSADLARLMIDYDVPSYDVNIVPEGMKYVVLCDKIGGKPIYGKNDRGEQTITGVLPVREKGQVLTVEELGGKWEVCRLLIRPKPFLRPATPFEATQERVTVTEDARRNAAVQELLDEEKRKVAAMLALSDQKDAEIGRLRSLMAQPQPVAATAASHEMLAQRNQTIDALQRQNTAMQEQLGALTREIETLKAGKGEAPKQDKGNGGGQGRR